jgi:putative Mg2+ transporter-C (MgtC) family protein
VPLQVQLELFALVALAALLSMIIGIEREWREQPAGMRTHMLVGLGACLFTVLSIRGFTGGDPTRVAAGVVSGIGFLGAGTILQRQHKGNVKNLTTAASIWTTAAIGMAVGLGAWLLSIGVTVLVIVILVLLRQVEQRFFPEEDSVDN